MNARYEPDVASFRSHFPVLQRVAYLNAGTAGPMPVAAQQAALEVVAAVAQAGRGSLDFWRHAFAGVEKLRRRYASLLGCSADEVAITSSTTEGVNVVLSGLGLQVGDEVLTSDEEHVGMVAPLAAAARRGVRVRVVPFDEVPFEPGPRTRLIACSHVSWVTGKPMDTAALAATGIPVLLDGAQAMGAISFGVRSTGCDYYAASGQKWLCGADGTGCLYVRADRIPALEVTRPGCFSFSDPLAVRPALHPGARRFDTTAQGILIAWSLAAFDLLEAAGWPWIFERACSLADHLARLLADKGLEVAPRGRTTLVSWEAPDAQAVAAEMSAAGVEIRSIPDRDLLRASIGAWSTEGELERLADLASRLVRSRSPAP